MTQAVFVCPRCTSRYKIVRMRELPSITNSLTRCEVCKESLPSAGEEFTWQPQRLLPWMLQTHVADAKIEQFENALKTIAALDCNSISSDQLNSTARQAVTIAQAALAKEGLSGTRWEWVATDAVHGSNE
jgi:hypothetical protein